MTFLHASLISDFSCLSLSQSWSLQPLACQMVIFSSVQYSSCSRQYFLAATLICSNMTEVVKMYAHYSNISKFK